MEMLLLIRPLNDPLTPDHEELLSDLKSAYPAIDSITARFNAEHGTLMLTVKSGDFTFRQPTGERALQDRANRVRRLGTALMSSINDEKARKRGENHEAQLS
jgi:hypothetical protein